MFWNESPMGIYQRLDAFREARGKPMGAPGTRPWIQGYPYLERLPEGPALPDTVEIDTSDRKYPDRFGHPELREGIAAYYRDLHGANVDAANVMVLGGGRQAIFSVLSLHAQAMRAAGETSEVVIEEIEYTPYWDDCRFHGLKTRVVESSPANRFRPTPADHLTALEGGHKFWIKSNPCNPTGVVWGLDELAPVIEKMRGGKTMGFVDEAYDFFVDTKTQSALAAVDNLEDLDFAVIGAATKGLQFPGARIGWVVGSRRLVNALGSFCTFAIGGVSRPSQKFIELMLDPPRVRQHRESMSAFNRSQSEQYGAMLEGAGVTLHTGAGGFYHWCEAPEGMTARDIDQRILEHDAAILPGVLCDMNRPQVETPEWDAYTSPLDRYFRLSFGPCGPGDPPGDAEIWRAAFGS